MSLRFRFVILIIMLIAGAVSTAFANQNVTIQGRLLEADLTPITANSVQFVVQVRSSGTEDCLLYEETQTLNLNTTQGAFALVLGTGTRSNSTIDGGNSLEKVFSNNGTLSLTAATTPCANASTSYTPGVSSTRIVNVTYNDGTGWDTIPAIPLSWVPQAMYAQDAGMLGGVSATSYVLQTQFPTCASGDFLTKTASGTFTCANAAASLGIIESVSSTNNYITATTSGTDVYLTANLGSAALYNIGTTSGSIPLLTSSGTLAASVFPTNILTSATVFAGDLSGSPSSLTITAVSGKPAAQIATSVNDTQAATATATASTIVKRDGSGGISVTGLSLNNLYLYNAANYLQLRSSTSLSSNYTLTFPAALGSSGTVLSTDGAGQLAWINTLPSYSGDVTSTSGTSTLTLSNSGVVSGTYGKVSVDVKGRVTSGNPLSATDVITALGYTPANSATAAAGLLLATNNLSDVSSSATARTNLGLGATAVLNFIDLGTTYASGTLAAARLPAYSGDVTSVSGSAYLTLANSGVTSATYTKVSVNAKGLITSGSAITSSDVITALGYTPANSATVAAVSLLKANNLSDLASATVARTNLELGATSVLDFIDLGTTFASGTLAAARLPAYSGDVTSVSGSAYLTLANSGVTSGTYTKVLVNAKGIITSGSAITNSDVVTALGYTPANSATIGITSLNGSSSSTQIFALGSFGTTPGVSTSLLGVHTLHFPLASTNGVTAGLLSNADYASFANKITSSAASIAETLGYTPANSATVLVPSLLKANNLSDVVSATVARTNLELGTAAVLNVGVAANNIVQLDSSARLPSVNGSLITSVTRNNIAADTANYVVINSSSGTLTSEASLAVSRGGTAATSFTANALIMTNGTGTAFTSATCSGGEILRWNAIPGSWACTSVLAAISATAVVNNGNSLGASVTIGTNDNNDFNLKTNNTLRLHVANSGNIGIGLGSNIAASTTLQVGGAITPQTDNTITLGSATFRWSTVHAGNGLIQTSDGREKNHIESSNLGLEFINEIEPVSYHWKKGSDRSMHYGFIAQDLEKILRKYTQASAMVDHDKETGRYGIRYTELISPLVKSVQELNGKLVRENSQLQSQVNQLKEENNSIKQYICLKDPSAVFCNRQ